MFDSFFNRLSIVLLEITLLDDRKRGFEVTLPPFKNSTIFTIPVTPPLFFVLTRSLSLSLSLLSLFWFHGGGFVFGLFIRSCCCCWLFIAFYILIVHPEPESRCCKINPGLGVSPPNWMGSMSYVGEEIADEVESNRWDAADGVHIYWSAKKDDRPVSIKRATTLGVTYIHFTSFEPGSSDPPGGFTLPTDLGDCSDLCIPEEQ